MSLPTLVLANSDLSTWLEGCLQDVILQHVGDADDLLDKVGSSSGHQLLFVQVDTVDSNGHLPLMQKLTALQSDITLVAIANQSDAARVLDSVRAGASDFLVKGVDDDRLIEMVKAVTKRGNTRHLHQHAQIISILSGQADTGLAFLGQHMALAVAEMQRQDESVLLLDIANPTGAAAIFMNVQPEYGALDAIADAYRCDDTLVNTAFTRHPQGPYVLSLSETQNVATVINADDLGRFLDIVGGYFNKVIVCGDAGLGNGGVRNIAEVSNNLLIHGDQSILCTRHNQQLVRDLRNAGVNMDNCSLVVDRYQKSVDLEPAKLAGLLQLPLIGVLAGDSSQRIKAMNAGDSLYVTAPGDEYVRNVRRLTQQLMGRTEVKASRPGLLGKFLGHV